ncbi:MAG TPA: acyl-CoA dehydrogenase [Candidatus Eisenbacteria bacterium]|nr:acyl-CoA dehydrogenase [Candidatus Eisenbacteria bacterium]
MVLLYVLIAIAIVFAVPPIRRALVTRWVMPILAGALPKMGETERIALEAGTVWWDAELFSGRPRWKKLLEFKPKPLSPKERAFLDGPVEELCRMVHDWDVLQKGDLSPETWAHLKKHRFFGMIIPESYGGLGFSALAHSAVITKISSRSVTAAVTAMVPNSLGPAELLLHYGTEAQKNHYLPRLATAEEIPCFALTEPGAGSDATAQRSEGVVCKGTFEGREVLGMRLNWNKRYITLAPAATVLGLAFRLRDPDKLLGGKEDLGITCALLPARLPGVMIGERHDPLGVPFLNGPTFGTDVFAPLDFIIGGPANAGKGWRMLMDCLAAGRGISLPSLSVGASELAARTTSAYANVREQFGLPIGRFEGIEEPLARIAGLTYMLDAARKLTAGAIDAGEKPAVISAIVKRYATEGMRAVVNDAMDIQAGAAISRGPRNILSSAYASVPVGITVEGANILTRSLIVYGQGAIRCHPYVQSEMRAVAEKDLVAFDRAFFGHVGHTIGTGFRAFGMAIFGGGTGGSGVSGPAGPMFGKLSRYAAAFALVSDAAMVTLGGTLKRRERLSGRLADALAWMYIASAMLKRFVDDGQPKRDLPYARWAAAHAFHQIEVALTGVLENLPSRPAAWLLRLVAFPLGAHVRPVPDREVAAVAHSVLSDAEAREHLTADIFVPPPGEPGLGALEAAYRLAMAAAPAEKKLKDAIRARKLKPLDGCALFDAGVEAGLISDAERRQLCEALKAREDVVQVDAFGAKEYAEQRR